MFLIQFSSHLQTVPNCCHLESFKLRRMTTNAKYICWMIGGVNDFLFLTLPIAAERERQEEEMNQQHETVEQKERERE